MEKGEALELMAACMTRNMKGLTNKVSGWPKVSPLERMVRFDIHVQPTPQSFVFVRHHDHFHLALHCEVRE